MAALQVKPTRMELSNLKKKRKVAVRGHKLMKDKRDEMVRRFILYIRKNKELRQEVEEKLAKAMQGFVLARASMSTEAIEEALCYPAQPATIQVDTQHVLSIQVPKLQLDTQGGFDYPYGFMTTSAELDGAVQAFAQVLPLLIQLAEVEKGEEVLLGVEAVAVGLIHPRGEEAAALVVAQRVHAGAGEAGKFANFKEHFFVTFT